MRGRRGASRVQKKSNCHVSNATGLQMVQHREHISGIARIYLNMHRRAPWRMGNTESKYIKFRRKLRTKCWTSDERLELPSFYTDDFVQQKPIHNGFFPRFLFFPRLNRVRNQRERVKENEQELKISQSWIIQEKFFPFWSYNQWSESGWWIKSKKESIEWKENRIKSKGNRFSWMILARFAFELCAVLYCAVPKSHK